MLWDVVCKRVKKGGRVCVENVPPEEFLISRNANRLGKNLSEDTIRHELEGNICRCTGYHNIVAAVKAGAANM